MGDLRYYTFYQFNHIVILTVFIVVMTVAFMVNMYKSSVEKPYSRFIGLSIILLLISRFIVEVAFRELIINLFQYLEIFILFIFNILVFYMHANKMRKEKKLNEFQMFYLFSFFIPTIILCINDAYRYYVYASYIVYYCLIINKLSNYKMSSEIFNDVKKMMLDYVYIISDTGKIIFKNDKISESSLFREIIHIDINEIEKIFSEKAIIRESFGKRFIKIVGENCFYFQYRVKEIKNEDLIVGYILTFIDVSELVSMIDDLENKQIEIIKVNKELNHYKDVVYDMEKEKEINNLLQEIAKNQQESMLILKSEIEKLSIYSDDFYEEISKDIDIAKKDLKDVRKAVTAYMNYYNEGETHD